MRPWIIVIVLAVAVTVHATVRLVPQQYATIQAAINATAPGDTVLVAPGVYVENVQMREGVSLFGSGMDKTIVDGGGLANVITSPYGVLNLVISDLSARNAQQSGSAPGCVGIHLNPNSSSGTKIVRRCHVYHNGHGIQIWNDFGGTVYIEGNVIDDNLYDGFSPYLGTVYLRNDTIVDNGRDGYNDWSGGGNVTVQNNVFALNGRYGIFRHPSTPVAISYNDVWANASGNYMQGSPPTPFTPSPGTGEISADPLFVGIPYPLHAQYYISWQSFPLPDSSRSPCIDAGNPSTPFNDPDGTRGDMGALPFDQREAALNLILQPVGPPWVVPPGGGNLTYDLSISNPDPTPQACQVWMMLLMPNGNQYGPLVGPAQVTVPANGTISRRRAQYIPASAPPGDYVLWALVGNYPTHAWDWFGIPFTKQSGAGDEDRGWVAEDWTASDDFGEWGVMTRSPSAITERLVDDFKLTISPNPFNAMAAIRFDLPEAAQVTLEVFDIEGRRVGVQHVEPLLQGYHTITFDGSGLPSGVYLCRIQAGERVAMQKVVLMK